MAHILTKDWPWTIPLPIVHTRTVVLYSHYLELARYAA